jgi:hypothetical protein
MAAVDSHYVGRFDQKLTRVWGGRAPSIDPLMTNGQVHRAPGSSSSTSTSSQQRRERQTTGHKRQVTSEPKIS